MIRVFVDTVGLVALWDEADQWHDAAAAAWTKVLASRAVPVTTPYVLAECANAASRRPYRAYVDPVRRQFERANTLIWPTPEEWEQAWSAYTRGKPGDAGVVDHVSFAVMRRLGVADASTNNRHFAAAGFNTLF